MDYPRPDRVDGRMFLVGCPRSGTTLLQSLIGAHPAVTSFPESHYFKRLLPAHRWLRPFGLASSVARQQFLDFLDDLPQDGDMTSFCPSPWTLRTASHVRSFVSLLDTIAMKRGARYWLEKTPGHIRHIDTITEHVPSPMFIHLVRSGPDVIASLYDVTRRYPNAWDGPWSLDRCTRQWIEDVSVSMRVEDRPDHHLVRYEALTADPVDVTQTLFASLNIPADATILSRRTDAVDQIRNSREPWKEGVDKRIKNANRSKFKNLLSEKEQTFVLEEITASGLSKLSVS